MKYVIDTNIAVALLEQRAEVTERVALLTSLDVGLPVIVLAELLFGARRSRRVDANVERVERLAEILPVLPVTRPIAERYASLRAAVTERGRPKGDFDLVIACTALEHGATLVTNDGALKDGVIGELRVEDWLVREST